MVVVLTSKIKLCGGRVDVQKDFVWSPSGRPGQRCVVVIVVQRTIVWFVSSSKGALCGYRLGR